MIKLIVLCMGLISAEKCWCNRMAREMFKQYNMKEYYQLNNKEIDAVISRVIKGEEKRGMCMNAFVKYGNTKMIGRELKANNGRIEICIIIKKEIENRKLITDLIGKECTIKIYDKQKIKIINKEIEQIINKVMENVKILINKSKIKYKPKLETIIEEDEIKDKKQANIKNKQANYEKKESIKNKQANYEKQASIKNKQESIKKQANYEKQASIKNEQANIKNKQATKNVETSTRHVKANTTNQNDLSSKSTVNKTTPTYSKPLGSNKKAKAVLLVLFIPLLMCLVFMAYKIHLRRSNKVQNESALNNNIMHYCSSIVYSK